jgi:hypothetical protein
VDRPAIPLAWVEERGLLDKYMWTGQQFLKPGKRREDCRINTCNSYRLGRRERIAG